MNSGLILVIEDNPEMQELVRIILEQEGYVVLSAKTGNEAISVLQSNSNISLALLDCRLPDMSASTFLERKEHERIGEGVPIIFFSAAVDLLQMKLPPSVVGTITKPFHISELLKVVEKFKHLPEVLRPTEEHLERSTREQSFPC